MTENTLQQFQARLARPAGTQSSEGWCFVVLPKNVSDTLPRRGRTSVCGTVNGPPFTATLEPDGQQSHWLKLMPALLSSAGIGHGDTVLISLQPQQPEPEPELPVDFAAALTDTVAANRSWQATTTLARVDWIHWITSAKQPDTRIKRINDACSMLAAGKKRVCCFDPSGFYSKAFSAPIAADD